MRLQIGPARKVPTRTSRVFDVKMYGAKGDCRYSDDVTMTAGSTILTSAAAGFASTDSGKPISVLGAGPSVNGRADPLSSTISSVSGHTAVLADAAQTNVSNAHASWGTDDTASIQKAIDGAAATGEGRVSFPAGTYRMTGVLRITASNIRVTGAGHSSVVYQSAVHTWATGGEANQGDGFPELYIGLKGTPVSNIEIDHLTFANSGTEIHNAVNGNGLITVLDGTTVNDFSFHDLTIETSSRCGITQAGISKGFEIYRNKVVGGLHGFYITGKGSNGYIHDNNLVNSPRLRGPFSGSGKYNSCGMCIKDQNNLRVTDNTIESYRWAVLISDYPEQHVVVDHNKILHSELGIATNQGSDLVFTNNLIETASKGGIWVRASNLIDVVEISNNIIRNVGSYAISVSKLSTGDIRDVTISNNRFFDCASGIRFMSVGGSNVIDSNIAQRRSLAKSGVGFSLEDLLLGNTKFTHNVSIGFERSELPPDVIQGNNRLN